MAIHSEELVQLLTKGQKYGMKQSPIIILGVNKTKVGNNRPKPPPIKRLTPEKMRARRKKNLCFNCDEIFHVGHKCKKLYMILAEDDEENNKTLAIEVSKIEYKEPQISLNVVSGQTPANTIKLLGRAGGYELVILMDSGSTHSFLDPHIAKRLGCLIEYTNPWVVTVADENKVECNSRCPHFKWEMGGHKFSTPVRLIKLGGCDMMIGVDMLY